MSTPSPRPRDTPLDNSGPPCSFLRQLLEEINGDDGLVASRRRASSQSTLASWTTMDTSQKRRSSVWVGGEPIAQDARNKLRAADETRLRRASIQGTDGTPALRSTPQLASPQRINGSSAPQRKSTGPAHIDLNLNELGDKSTPRTILRTTNNAASPCQKLDSSGSYMSCAQPLILPGDTADRAISPLIFCDIDSDVSLTSSDSEPPTSATTEGSTQASTWSNGNRATRQSISRKWWTIPLQVSTD